MTLLGDIAVFVFWWAAISVIVLAPVILMAALSEWQWRRRPEPLPPVRPCRTRHSRRCVRLVAPPYDWARDEASRSEAL